MGMDTLNPTAEPCTKLLYRVADLASLRALLRAYPFAGVKGARGYLGFDVRRYASYRRQRSEATRQPANRVPQRGSRSPASGSEMPAGKSTERAAGLHPEDNAQTAHPTLARFARPAKQSAAAKICTPAAATNPWSGQPEPSRAKAHRSNSASPRVVGGRP